jgi:hypothetical protein
MTSSLRRTPTFPESLIRSVLLEPDGGNLCPERSELERALPVKVIA